MATPSSTSIVLHAKLTLGWVLGRSFNPQEHSSAGNTLTFGVVQDTGSDPTSRTFRKRLDALVPKTCQYCFIFFFYRVRFGQCCFLFFLIGYVLVSTAFFSFFIGYVLSVYTVFCVLFFVGYSTLFFKPVDFCACSMTAAVLFL